MAYRSVASCLTHGDTIRVGRCELVFLIGDESVEDGQMLQFRDADPVDLVTTTNIRAYPSVSRPGTDVGRMARDLNALFKITTILNSIRDLEELQQRLLQLLGEVIPSRRRRNLILRHADEEPTSSYVWHRATKGNSQLQIRRELVQRALWERSPVFSRPAPDSEEKNDSLVCSAGGSGKTIGVLYMTADGKAGELSGRPCSLPQFRGGNRGCHAGQRSGHGSFA